MRAAHLAPAASAIVVLLGLMPGSMGPLAIGQAVAQPESFTRFKQHTVVKGDTCWALAERFLKNPRRWREIARANPGIGCEKGQMNPGVVLKIPGVGPDALLAAMKPDVETRAPEVLTWSPGHPGQDLYRGWRVSTLDEASADIEFPDDSHVRLRENTLVIIYGGTVRPVRRASTSARLDRGTLMTRLGELSGRKLLVETPASRTQLDEGRAMVSVEPEEGTTMVANHEGEDAEVSSRGVPGPPVKVAQGMGTRVVKGQPPTPPRPLPDPPEWSGGPARYVALPGVGARPGGAWTPARNAARYRVEVERLAGDPAKPDGSVALVEVPGRVNRFEVQGLPPGRYQARASTVDDAGFEGRPSEPFVFEVVELAMATPPRDDAQRARLVMGTVLTLPEGLACGLGGAPVGETVALTRPGTFELRCEDDLGRTSPGPRVVVEPATLRLEQVDGGPALRGSSSDLVLVVEGPTALTATPGLVPGFGLEAGPLTLESAQRFAFTVDISDQARTPVELEVVADPGGAAISLGRVTLEVADAPAAAAAPADGAPAATPGQEAATPAQPERRAAGRSPSGLTRARMRLAPRKIGPPPGHSQRTLARMPTPRTMGLDDPALTDDAVWLFSRSLDETRAEGEAPRYLLGYGGRVMLMDERLRIEASQVIALDAGLSPSAPGGSAGGQVGAGWRIGNGRPWAVGVDGDVWIEPDGRLKIRPSASFSLRMAGALVLRTRQGVSIGTDGKTQQWTSAYGADYTLIGPIAVSAMMEAGLGPLDNTSSNSLLASGLIGIFTEVFSLTAGVRQGLADEPEGLTLITGMALSW